MRPGSYLSLTHHRQLTVNAIAEWCNLLFWPPFLFTQAEIVFLTNHPQLRLPQACFASLTSIPEAQLWHMEENDDR